jgi:D-inositol-3-phosphate glycosyltransferase
MKKQTLTIAMFSIHSSPIGELGSRDTGGMSVYIREIAAEFGRCGHRVDIFSRHPQAGAEAVIHLDANVRLIHLGGTFDGSLKKAELYPHLEAFFSSFTAFNARDGARYDLIHSHYWLSGKVGGLIAESLKIPHVITFHTLGAVKNITGVGEEEPELRIVAEKELSRSSDGILSATAREKEELVRYYGADPDKIDIVPCGVNFRLFRPVEKAMARRQLGLARNSVILLYVGRFDPLKGIDRLLAALAYLQHHPQLHLMLIGGDGRQNAETRRLKRLARALGVDANITFVGRVDQKSLPPYYSAADVLVVASHYESFGLVGLEALACGTPVVTTPVGAMDKVIEDGTNGYVAVEGGPGSLAKGIESIINGTRRGGFSADAIRASVLKYNWSAVASGAMQTYEALCQPLQGGPLRTAAGQQLIMSP